MKYGFIERYLRVSTIRWGWLIGVWWIYRANLYFCPVYVAIVCDVGIVGILKKDFRTLVLAVWYYNMNTKIKKDITPPRRAQRYPKIVFLEFSTIYRYLIVSRL